MNLSKHLKERHFQAERYSVFLCEDVVIFPLWNLSGQMVGYQQYRPSANKEKRNYPRDCRYYTSVHGDKHSKPIAVWGVDTLHYRKDIVVIVEGIFDACRLHNHGIPCVALLSSSYKPHKNWLTSLGRKVYKVEDDHGSGLGPYEGLKLPEGVADLGECTEDQVKDLVSQIK